MNEIDNRIIEMEFDNKRFEKNAQETIRTLQALNESMEFKEATKNLQGVQNAFNSIKLDALSNAIDHIEKRVSIFGQHVTNTVHDTVNKIVGLGKNVYSEAFTIPKNTGFKEYELQMNAIQTIWANTKDKGTSMEDIKSALGELNEYADKTIYNFSQMTDNIGRFTSAGVDLETSVKSIKGIANLAAISGSTSQQASTAMYQLSQALASGTVKLMDWNSVVNAGMGGQNFQNALKQTAKEMGIVIDETKSFRDTLESGWLTSDVLVRTLEKYTDLSTDLGRTATEAATQVKTFTQLMDTTKEFLGSGWAQSWQYIIGDFEEARDLFTLFSKKIESILQPSIDARNEMLRYWSQNGEINKEAEKQLKEQEKVNNELDTIAKRVISGEFGNVDTGRFKKLIAEGYDPNAVQKRVDQMLGIISSGAEEAADEIDSVFTGREMAIEGLKNIFTELGKIAGAVSGAFRDIFPKTTGEKLVEMSKALYDFSQTFKVSEKTVERVRDTFRGIFSTFSIGIKVIKAVGSAFTAFFSVLPKGDNLILRITSTIGKTIYNFNKMLDETQLLRNVFTSFGKTVGSVVILVTGTIGVLIDKITSIANESGIVGVFKTAYESVKGFIGSISDAVNSMGDIPVEGAETLVDGLKKPFSVFDNFANKITTIAKGIKKALTTLWGFIKPVLTAIKDAIIGTIGSDEVDAVMQRLKEAGLIYLLVELANFVKNVNNVGDILDGLADSLNAFTGAVKAQVLKTIAGALLILAASVIALSLIPANMLKNGLIAISLLGVELAGIMALFMLLGKGKGKENKSNIFSTAAAILVLTTALGQLLVAVTGFSLIPTNMLLKGGAAVAGALLVMALAVRLLPSDKNVLMSAAGILVLTTALNGLILPLTFLSLMPLDKLQNGLIAFMIILGSVIIFAKAMDKSADNLLTASGGLALFAAALNMLILPLSALALLPLAMLLKGGVVIGAFMAAAVMFANSLPQNISDVGKAGSYLIAIAAALNLLVVPIALLSMLDPLKMVMGLTAVIVLLFALSSITDKIKDLGEDAPKISGSLLILAAAIVALTAPIEFLSKLSVGELATGLVPVLAIMAMLIATIAILKGPAIETSIAGLASLVGAIALLSGTVALLAGSDAGSIVTATLAIVGLMAAFAGLTALLGVISTTFPTVGVLVTALATGFVMFSAGVLGLVLALNLLTAIDFNSFLDQIDSMKIVVEEFVSSLITGISESIPKLAEALGEGFVILIETICESILETASTILETIVELLGIIAENTAEITEKIVEIMVGVFTGALYGLGDNMGEIIAAIHYFVISFINAFADYLGDPNTVEEIMDAMKNLFISSLGFIANILAYLWEAGKDLLDEIICGIQSVAETIFDPIKDFFANFGSNIADWWGDLKDAGKDIINGIVEGIKNAASGIWEALKDAAGSGFKKFCDFFHISSPSKLMRDTSKWIPIGAGLGIEDEASSFIDPLGTMGEDGMTAFSDSITNGLDTSSFTDQFSSLGNGIGEAFNNSFVNGIDADALNEQMSGLTNAMNADVNNSAYITPVFDSSNISSGLTDLDGMMSERNMLLGEMNNSINGKSSYENIMNSTFDDSRVLNRIDKLTNEVVTLSERMTRMQVVLDSGSLVGAIAPDMDSALGHMSVRKARGV